MTTDRGSSHFASRNLESAGQIQVSSLAAALAHIETDRTKGILDSSAWIPLYGVVLQAARERLRLSKIPCETCDGTGMAGVYSHIDKGTGEHQGDEPIRCDACGGSGEVWPAELVEIASSMYWEQYYKSSWDGPLSDAQRLMIRDAMSAVLDAIAVYLAAGVARDD